MNKELQDLVWSILPKEFKEEVKKVARIYSGRTSALFGAERHIANKFLDEFIGLFGHDNLTSDAEEEEMLTVSRKKVQRRYHMAYKCKHSGLLSHDDVQFWKGWQGALDDLFGSKCLPDELPEDNFAKSEPNPAEPKFKVGDYVRYKGGVHKVVATAKDNRCYLNKILGCIDESDLEPYTEPKENIAETRNFSQDCDKQVDAILKDSFSKERRLNVAVQLTCAMIPKYQDNGDGYGLSVLNEKDMIKCAYRLADMLIAEAEKGGLK